MQKQINISKLEEESEQFLPIVIEKTTSNLQLPDPILALYYENLRKRIIYIDFPIEQEPLMEISKLIIKFNQEDKLIPIENRIPIKLLIYTYGGDLNATLSFADLCQISKTPIYTYNMGVALSAGLVILLAGSKRFGLPNSRALIHNGSGGVQGDYEKVEAQMEAYKKSIKLMQKYILDRTQMSETLYNKNKTKDWWISSQEQLDYGILHELITDIDLISY